jgi:tetratricopeptide (TPR) repeat protein
MPSRREPFSSEGSSTGDSFLNIRFILLLLFLLAAPKPGLGQQDQDTAFISAVAAAQKAQAANDYASAATYYKQAVQMRQDIPELWANLGLMQHESKDYLGSEKSFQEALKLKPSLYVPHLFLGMDYLSSGRAKEAIPYLLKAEKMNNTDPLPSLTLGRAYSSLGDVVSAAHAYGRAVQLDPKNSSGWFGLGLARLAQVENDGRHIVELDQTSPYAKVLFAESLAKQSRYKEAATLYQEVLAGKLQPPCTRSELGLLSLKQKDIANADLEFKADQLSNKGCSLAFLGQARLNIDSGADLQALQLLEDLWRKDQGFVDSNASVLSDGTDPIRAAAFQEFIAERNTTGSTTPGLYLVLSATFTGNTVARLTIPSTPDLTHTAQEDYSAGHYRRCAERLKSKADRKNPAQLELLATCAYLTGDYRFSSNASEELAAIEPHSLAALFWSVKSNEHLAFSAFEKFQELEPNSARSHLLLGDIYRQRRRFDDAQAEYKKALEISPNDPAGLIGLASAYYGDAKIDKTIQTAQLALNQTPDDPELNLLMAEAMMERHPLAPAEPFLLKALNSKPQMLPHVHALLGQVYAEAGATQLAIDQFKLGLDTDLDGSLHYQLARLYRKLGDTKAADMAMEQMKVIKQQQRQRAVIDVQDSHPSTLDGP